MSEGRNLTEQLKKSNFSGKESHEYAIKVQPIVENGEQGSHMPSKKEFPAIYF